MNGAKKGTAPCGHVGSFVTANFVTCDQACYRKAVDVPAISVALRCPKCSSNDIEPFRIYMFAIPGLESWRCLPCDCVWSVTSTEIP